MDKDFRFSPADSTVYSRWVHRTSWTLEDASWVLSGYERDDFRFRDDLLEADIERMSRVHRYELALQEGVEQEECSKSMCPTEWITFAHKRGIDIPSALEKFFPDGCSVFQRCEDLERELSISRAEIAALQTAKQDAAAIEKSIAPRERNTLLNIIGGLLGLMLSKTPAGKSQSVFKDQAAIIAALLVHYPNKTGISQRTLDGNFAAANRMLNQP